MLRSKLGISSWICLPFIVLLRPFLRLIFGFKKAILTTAIVPFVLINFASTSSNAKENEHALLFIGPFDPITQSAIDEAIRVARINRIHFIYFYPLNNPLLSQTLPQGSRIEIMRAAVEDKKAAASGLPNMQVINDLSVMSSTRKIEILIDPADLIDSTQKFLSSSVGLRKIYFLSNSKAIRDEAKFIVDRLKNNQDHFDNPQLLAEQLFDSLGVGAANLVVRKRYYAMRTFIHRLTPRGFILHNRNRFLHWRNVVSERSDSQRSSFTESVAPTDVTPVLVRDNQTLTPDRVLGRGAIGAVYTTIENHKLIIKYANNRVAAKSDMLRGITLAQILPELIAELGLSIKSAKLEFYSPDGSWAIFERVYGSELTETTELSFKAQVQMDEWKLLSRELQSRYGNTIDFRLDNFLINDEGDLVLIDTGPVYSDVAFSQRAFLRMVECQENFHVGN